MRKLSILVALLTAAAMSTAKADDKKKALAKAALRPAAEAPAFIKEAPGVLQFGFSMLKKYGPQCEIDIKVILDGVAMRVHGQLTASNVGDLYEYGGVEPVGTFVLAGNLNDGAILIEVANPIYADKSILGIYMITDTQSKLIPSSRKFFFTDGDRLNNWSGDVRSAGLNTETLTYRFEQAANADEFFLFLQGRGHKSPRDSVARPADCGNCDGVATRPGVTPLPAAPVGVIVPGGPVYVGPGAPPVVVAPYGRTSFDSSLRY